MPEAGGPEDWRLLSDEELAARLEGAAPESATREQALAERDRRRTVRLERAADLAERAARRSEVFAGVAIFVLVACTFACWRACSSRPVTAASPPARLGRE